MIKGISRNKCNSKLIGIHFEIDGILFENIDKYLSKIYPLLLIIWIFSFLSVDVESSQSNIGRRK